MKSTFMKLASLVIILSFVLAACSTPATQKPEVVTTQAPAAATEAKPAEKPTEKAAANPTDYLNAARADTMIFDQPYQLTSPKSDRSHVVL